MLSNAISKLVERQNLSEAEMMGALTELMQGSASPVLIGGFLSALRVKGETAEEITAGARVMRNLAERIDLDDLFTLDTCGTGGDKSGVYNVSTAAAFVCAAAGVHVAKHGNRSVSSRCGSADVLEALGAHIHLNPEQAAECVRQQHIGFLFAPLYHKAMKHAAVPRKELGVRTIFNVLGPLTNPARAKAQLLGVFDEALTETLAQVLSNLGVQHALVVCGKDGLDEISSFGETRITELYAGRIRTYTVTPETYGIKRCTLQSLLGGDAVENARLIRALFEGQKGPKLDFLLMNCGAALYAANRVPSIHEGIALAARLVESGAAKEKLDAFVAYTRRFL